jgi:2-polyprenyl-3-methyl-5-hydroxy-6-metoxy-1,4-benzoquinol methylase
MSRFKDTISRGYFDELYTGQADPWQFEASEYEQAKYAVTLAALPRQRYKNALEIGCSIGVLTGRLALRCEALIALDIANAALESARARCGRLPHVTFQQAAVPRDWPSGIYDLILLSEVIYYLDASDVGWLADRVASSVAPGGDILLVHWLGETHYPLSGDEAAGRFIDKISKRAKLLQQNRLESYRLDLLRMV